MNMRDFNMTKEKTIDVLMGYPVKVLLIGVKWDGKDWVVDGVSCCSHEEIEREKKKFESYRIFKLVEFMKH